MKPGVATRVAAARCLGRVLRGGAYSNIVVPAEAERMEGADQRHTQRLLMGALRALPRLDAAIAASSDRPLERLNPELSDVLRIAAYEIEQGAARYAVVDSAVEAARLAAGGGPARFANAVLRRLRPVDSPDRALRHGIPPWLLERVDGILDGAADQFWTASNQAVKRAIWSDTSIGEPVEGIMGAQLVEAGAELPAGSLVLDPASVAVVHAMDIGPGMRVADLAAAPGGKTALIGRMAGSGGVVACDVHERRLGRARRRVGSSQQWVVADARTPPFPPASFERVLLDVPCTGLGTLRRRPEIRWRLEADSPRRMGVLQRSMLEAVIPLIVPGGRLVYSACTIFPEETIEVVAPFGAVAPRGLPGEPWGDGWLLSPHRTETDGMFIAVIEA